MENLVEKINKKAFTEISEIATSSNMLQVQDAISMAILKTFGLHNIGLTVIAMRKRNCTDTEVGTLKAVRYFNHDTNKQQAISYLTQFVPQRLKSTTMYKKLYNN